MKQPLREVLCPQPKSKIKAGEGQIEGTYKFYTSSQTQSKFYDAATYTHPALIFGTGGMASVHFCDEPFSTSTDCLVMYGRQEAPLELIYYYLRSNVHLLQKGFKGAGLQHISKDYILNIEVDIPEPFTQKQMIHQLHLIDRTIRAKNQQLVSLDELVKSRFIELFGDPVSNSRGLPENTLPEMGEFGRGVSKHRPRNDPKLLGGKHPLIQTGDVAAADLYITEYNSTYSDLGLAQSKMWKKGTLCITIAANIAKTAILDFDACFPDSVVGFIANEKTNNVYIHYWFSFFQRILEAQAPESAQKNINLKILSELKVICPDKDEQDAFAAFVAEVDKSKYLNPSTTPQLAIA